MLAAPREDRRQDGFIGEKKSKRAVAPSVDRVVAADLIAHPHLAHPRGTRARLGSKQGASDEAHDFGRNLGLGRGRTGRLPECRAGGEHHEEERKPEGASRGA